MKSLWKTIFVLIGTLSTPVVMADPPPGPRTYGIICETLCGGRFDYPLALSGDTRNILDSFSDSQRQPLRPGDSVVICNRRVCIIYTKIENGWQAENPEFPRQPQPGTGSGGGGGGVLGGTTVIGIVTIGSVRPA
ncbi:MAG TPA: hypothetical protein VJ724_07930 [Tahibacter sp.]|nr:hypothetical protein [Tahibacter sp.]